MSPINLPQGRKRDW